MAVEVNIPRYSLFGKFCYKVLHVYICVICDVLLLIRSVVYVFNNKDIHCLENSVISDTNRWILTW